MNATGGFELKGTREFTLKIIHLYISIIVKFIYIKLVENQ